MNTIDNVLDEISALSLDDKELVEEILHKRIIEERRNEINDSFKESLMEYKSGKCKSGSADDLLNDLRELK